MKLKEFLEELLLLPGATLNEISVLLEMGYDDFSREDLLSKNSGRVPEGTYSAAALTKTIKKLASRKPALISTYLDSSGKIKYRLENDKPDYNYFQDLILNITRSKLMTLVSLKLALKLISEGNRPVTSYYLATNLNLNHDYLISVLQRMYIIGLVEKVKKTDLQQEKDADPNKLYFKLVENWTGYLKEIW